MRRSSGCAGSCTARTRWISDDDAFAAAVEQVREELVDGLLADPFDGSVEAEQYVARFSARWTRRLVDAVTVTDSPAVRSGYVLLGRPQWHEVQVLKFDPPPVRAGPPGPRAAPARPGPAAGHPGRGAAGLDLDPAEEARLPPRLHDLVELAEAELPAGTPDRAARARGRAIVDFVAALTDRQAVALLDALSGRSGQLWTDAFVL